MMADVKRFMFLLILSCGSWFWNESNYSRTIFGGRHKYGCRFYNNKDILACLTISECRERLPADVWYQALGKAPGEPHERVENVRCGAEESVYFLYTSFLVALTKNAIISLRPVPPQANLYLMVNNNKTLLLVVFTFVLEEFECP